MPDNFDWSCVLELDAERARSAGSEEALCDAIRRGADLRVYTEFRHNEHIDVDSDNAELIKESMDFRITYLLEDRWTAAILNLRQPVALPDCFGPRPSMSFFLYNQNGGQALARPYLDAAPDAGATGPSPAAAPPNMPRYHAHDAWDGDSNAPSSNFIYDFDVYRYYVRDTWQATLAHDPGGDVLTGSVEELAEAFAGGCDVKVAVRGLGSDLADDGADALDHEIFVHAGSCYYYTEQKLFITGSQPIVRVKPGIPLRYESRGWDFGWLLLRSDGRVIYRRCSPYTLRFEDIEMQCAMRWFVA